MILEFFPVHCVQRVSLLEKEVAHQRLVLKEQQVPPPAVASLGFRV
jgi:hypothetical protein